MIPQLLLNIVIFIFGILWIILGYINVYKTDGYLSMYKTKNNFEENFHLSALIKNISCPSLGWKGAYCKTETKGPANWVNTTLFLLISYVCVIISLIINKVETKFTIAISIMITLVVIFLITELFVPYPDYCESDINSDKCKQCLKLYDNDINKCSRNKGHTSIAIHMGTAILAFILIIVIVLILSIHSKSKILWGSFTTILILAITSIVTFYISNYDSTFYNKYYKPIDITYCLSENLPIFIFYFAICYYFTII